MPPNPSTAATKAMIKRVTTKLSMLLPRKLRNRRAVKQVRAAEPSAIEMPDRQKVPYRLRRNAACAVSAIKKITLALNDVALHCTELVHALFVHTGNRGNSMAERNFSIRRIVAWSRNQPVFRERKEFVMAETTIVGDRIEIVEAQNAGMWGALSWSGLSWSGIIAGAFTAIAVAFIFIALGSGIGLSLASPFSASPSAGTLTVLGAVWLGFAQAIGFATGGYVAGRVRRGAS